MTVEARTPALEHERQREVPIEPGISARPRRALRPLAVGLFAAALAIPAAQITARDDAYA